MTTKRMPLLLLLETKSFQPDVTDGFADHGDDDNADGEPKGGVGCLHGTKGDQQRSG